LKLPLYIAKRYLVAKKSHNAINIISLISLTGVATGTMALIIILSVFNGFDNLVRSLINSFNPDIKITLAQGKTFTADDQMLEVLAGTPGIYDFSLVLEDKALVRYDEQQTIADVRGVSDNYFRINGLDTMLTEGSPVLYNSYGNYAIIGQGIKVFLNVILNSPRQLIMYAPKRLSQMPLDPNQALTRKYLQPSAVFSIEQDFDTRYIIVPLGFARELFDYENNEINAVEVKISDDMKASSVQETLKGSLGDRFLIQNRYEQNEIFYKTMQTEKWAIFLILVFILAVASFNVIGTLTMLIIEKKKDIITLRNLGADARLIKKIFLLEGWLISAIGAVIGTIAGLLVCWIQIRFEPVRLQGSGSFIIDAYPVLVSLPDVFITIAVVLVVGFLAAWYPIHYLSRNYLGEINGG